MLFLMILFKVPFMLASFWIWNITSNERYAAAA
jgi:hypothetical protein